MEKSSCSIAYCIIEALFLSENISIVPFPIWWHIQGLRPCSTAPHGLSVPGLVYTARHEGLHKSHKSTATSKAYRTCIRVKSSVVMT